MQPRRTDERTYLLRGGAGAEEEVQGAAAMARGGGYGSAATSPYAVGAPTRSTSARPRATLDAVCVLRTPACRYAAIIGWLASLRGVS